MAKFYITPSTWTQGEYRHVVRAAELAEFYESGTAGCTAEDVADQCEPIDADDIVNACRIAYEDLCFAAERQHGRNWREYGTGLHPDVATAYGACDPMWDEDAERAEARAAHVDAALDAE